MITFSIITVVYNGAELLRGTMESVFQQDYPAVEYIVVDGGSKDQSVEIIREYAAKMPALRWISEKDRGLYDAMNKGLRMATGDFVCFMNAGDALYRPQTLRRLAECCTPDTDVLYGETMLVDEQGREAGAMSQLSTRRVPKNLNWQDYLGGMLVVHQSFYARRSLAPAYISGNLCADYDWCIEILKKSRRNTYTPMILTRYLMGGMSKKRHRQSLLDRFSVMRRHFGLWHTLWAHVWIVLRAGWHRMRRIGQKKY
jgi:glycosyltransferase involved in cell wall biosynthesis